LIALSAAVGGAWVGLRPVLASFNQPVDWPGPGTGAVQVRIESGATGTAIGQVLEANGVVRTVKAFVAAYRAEPRSASLQPGSYQLRRQMSAVAALQALLSGEARQVAKVTVPEGTRSDQLPDLIAKVSSIKADDVRAAIRTPAALGLPPEAKGDPEGWLFPATYDLEPGTTAAGLLTMMVDRSVAELAALNVPVERRRDVIIQASLVQAEAKNAVDFPKIARVLQNRMAKGRPLELDTTVHYAMKSYKVALSEKATKMKSPYNTYQVVGLPAGAIDNPGADALRAVLNPTPGAWMFFVAVNPNTGLTGYAVTDAEFLKLKAQLDIWLKANPGK
jgi:UPF0755 protein